jgi:hypothetical protein
LDYNLATGKSVGIDGSGNVFVTGNFNGGGSTWMFLDKYGSDGSARWAKRYGTASSSSSAFVSGSSLVVDSSGDAIVVGEFNSSISVGGDVLTNNAPAYHDLFLAKYAGNDGSVRWSKRYGSGYSDYANGITADSSGNIMITGRMGAPIDFGGGLLPYASGMNGYVSCVNPNGVHRWSKSFGLYIGDANSLAVSPGGNLFVTGSFTTLTGYGGNPLSGASGSIFLLEFGN